MSQAKNSKAVLDLAHREVVSTAQRFLRGGDDTTWGTNTRDAVVRALIDHCHGVIEVEKAIHESSEQWNSLGAFRQWLADFAARP